tara:strand:+ start:594 stop:1070 length:477 start_codon:yes stop_codon:yes gene_type:complete
MKTHRLFNKIDVSFLNSFVEEISIEKVLGEIEKKIPVCLFSEIDIIYVGKFDFLDDEVGCSKFMDNAIYLCNRAHYESDIVYDITSGLAESIEQKYIHLFYENKEVTRELENYWNADQHSTDNFVDVVYEFLIEDRPRVKQELPEFSGILQELVDEIC